MSDHVNKPTIQGLIEKWTGYRAAPVRILRPSIRYDELDEARDNALLDTFISDLRALVALTPETPQNVTVPIGNLTARIEALERKAEAGSAPPVEAAGRQKGVNDGESDNG